MLNPVSLGVDIQKKDTFSRLLWGKSIFLNGWGAEWANLHPAATIIRLWGAQRADLHPKPFLSLQQRLQRDIGTK